ncbi:hypothetical protein Tco_1284975 [Tanacetum coccineum]
MVCPKPTYKVPGIRQVIICHIRNEPRFILDEQTGALKGAIDKVSVLQSAEPVDSNQLKPPLVVVGERTAVLRKNFRKVSNNWKSSSRFFLTVYQPPFASDICTKYRKSFFPWVANNLLGTHNGTDWSASTILSQMAKLFAVIAPWRTRTFMICRPGMCSAFYYAIVGFDCSWKDHHTFFSFLPDVQHRHGSSHQSTQLKLDSS